MKNLLRISSSILLSILIHSCVEKPTPPVLTTTAVTEISYTSATSGGDVTEDRGAPVLYVGICWNTAVEPTLGNNKTIESGELGAFTSNITQLTPNTLYYVRAYATNSAGTAYGNEVSFTTSQVAIPVLTTAEVTAITQTTAVSGGNISDDKGGSVTARGICWSIVTNPTTSDSKTTDGTGTGSYVSNLVDLIPGTVYYVRSYATNSVGTSYGNEINFTTIATVPTLTTTEVSLITQITAVSGGNITSDGGASVSARGVCWNTAASPTTADSKTTNSTGSGSFISNLTGLTASTTYFIRAYATNSMGTAYGNEISFTTNAADTKIAADYYLPLCVGNYLKFHTTESSGGWGPRTSIYSIIRSETINGETYYLEKGSEIMDNSPAVEEVFRYFWLRKGSDGNILLGAFDLTSNGTLSSATIFDPPASFLSNQSLIVGYTRTYPNGEDETQTDSTASVTATVGSYTNCVQIRTLTKINGTLVRIDDTYYAYHMGIIKEERSFPTDDTHASQITDFVVVNCYSEGK